MSQPARVIVTGATGFVGRSLVPVLVGRGCEVWSPGRAELSGSARPLLDSIRDFAPRCVVHLVTRFVAQHEVDDLPDLVRSNVEVGTLMAEAASGCGARFVWMESAWQHFEGAEYDPVSLYAATKQALTDIIRYYERVRGLDAVDITLFDTYGPGDTRPKVVPLLLRAAKEGTALPMSDGRQLIDLTYVDDIVRGIADAALRPESHPGIVLRSDRPMTIRELVTEVETVTGTRLRVEWGARSSRPREMLSDWTFGERLPGWEALVGIREGLRRCWDAAQVDLHDC